MYIVHRYVFFPITYEKRLGFKGSLAGIKRKK